MSGETWLSGGMKWGEKMGRRSVRSAPAFFAFSPLMPATASRAEGGESNHDKNGPGCGTRILTRHWRTSLSSLHAAHRPLSTSSFFPRGVVGLVRSHHGERDRLVATGMGGWEEEGRITRCLPGGVGRRWSCTTTCHQPPPPPRPSAATATRHRSMVLKFNMITHLCTFRTRCR